MISQVFHGLYKHTNTWKLTRSWVIHGYNILPQHFMGISWGSWEFHGNSIDILSSVWHISYYTNELITVYVLKLDLTHTCTHAHKKAKPSAVVLAWSRLPSGPAVGYLCATTQVLWFSVGKSSWGRTSNPQETVLCLTGEGMGKRSPILIFTYYVRHG